MSEGTSMVYGSDLGKVIAKARSDPGFKKQLVTNPTAALVAAGVVVPAGVTVKVVENTEKLLHLVLPSESALSESELASVAGGMPAITIDFHR